MASAVDTAAPEGSVFPTLSDSLTAGALTLARFDRPMMRLSIGYSADGTEVERARTASSSKPA
jgi:hypothetical protein